jgi:magnesium transporter
MLTFYCDRTGRGGRVADLAGGSAPAEAVWIDLLQPTPEETAFVERATGLDLPSREELSEIESSSRLQTRDGALYLSAPLIFRAQSEMPLATPVGFVLTRERLVTVRFEELTAFRNFIRREITTTDEPLTSGAVFAELMDAVVDRLADLLEHIASELDILSHRLFRTPTAAARVGWRPPARQSADLRLILRHVGGNGDLVSKIRDSLLGVGRIAPYAASNAGAWLTPEIGRRLRTLRHDIASLADYAAHLDNKVQLLLDATLGLINVEQNNIIKVLTVVSVVGLPPTLVASIYGMNFKAMPELDWSWGYPYALAAIALSAVLPILWCKWRGWF